ncbi:hypothetical protein SODALDRAFT_29355 [Sodiomyces alkalinus F11]|uniref:Transmembrane protein n=1 Tax=Sodiomyces alkalinus (strain CBS 110278 / VKM F-3762 / F11) TaxID=1314773 RepID=A0A3N2Q8S6_SODAK|nr:hypothetical protein SODALDRAFT_29355 [Sodiomyces alkalinus F11]ROT43048.1 hypothetical protein SODALDRAFT_29355 [Sodiomyces alkalinus F11]
MGRYGRRCGSRAACVVLTWMSCGGRSARLWAIESVLLLVAPCFFFSAVLGVRRALLPAFSPVFHIARESQKKKKRRKKERKVTKGFAQKATNGTDVFSTYTTAPPMIYKRDAKLPGQLSVDRTRTPTALLVLIPSKFSPVGSGLGSLVDFILSRLLSTAARKFGV